MGTACKQACKGEGAPEDEAGPVQLVHDAGCSKHAVITICRPKAAHIYICMALKVAYGAERLAASAA